MEGGQGRREPPSIKSAGSATPVFVVADYDNEHDTDSEAGRICTSLQTANEMSWSSVPASLRLAFARRSENRTCHAFGLAYSAASVPDGRHGLALADPGPKVRESTG